MRYKKTIIVVKPTNRKKYSPELYEKMPYTSRIGNNTEDLYIRREEMIASIAEHLVRNPYRIIVLKNELPEKEKAIRKTLEGLVKNHHAALEKQALILKLGSGGKHRCLRKARRILRKAEE